MDARQAVEHASAVAREAVRLGLAEREILVGLYRDFQGYVQQGGQATFTELLLTRGLIDQSGFGRLEESVPPAGPIPAHLRASQGSQSFSVPAERRSAASSHGVRLPPAGVAAPPKDPWLETDPKGRPRRQDMPQWGDKTMEFDGVIQPGAIPPQGWVGDKTIEFDGVIRADGGPGQERDTAEYDAVLGKRVGAGSTGSVDHEAATDEYNAKTGEAAGEGHATAPERETDEYDNVLGVPIREVTPRSPDGVFGSAGLPILDSAHSSDLIEPESSDRLPVESEPKPGDTMGPYRIEKVLGRGGMGIIYKAHKDGGERRYALKVLVSAQDPGTQSGRKRQRFRREFEALRRLEHPHIVSVHDYGRQEPFDWYAMDYVAGMDFEQLLLRDKLDREAKLVVFDDICQAMAHAHARHVIHRDLKPQNVIVDDLGRGHVLDFGLAKILDQGLQMTRTGSTLGTPFYMAPEQLRSARDVDARADVFALGVILYELLTGARPFEGETAAEVGNRILSEDPVRPSKLDPSIHRDLDLVCLRALEKDAERRYGSAEELLEDLQRHKKGLRVKARGQLLAGARRWVRRNRAGILGGLIASVIFVPLILYLVLRLSRGDTVPTGPGSLPTGGSEERR